MSTEYLKYFYDNIFNELVIEKSKEESNINYFDYPEITDLNDRQFYWIHNRSLEFGDVPIDTTHLIFGDEYNKKLMNIPKSVIYIKFGENFNRKIGIGDFPENLRYIEFGEEFNQLIRPNIFPRLVEIIKFGTQFNRSIFCNVLPKNLKYLEFGWYFNKDIVIGSLPQGLKSLILSYSFNGNLNIKNIPKNLSRIHINNENYSGIIDKNLNLTELLLPRNYVDNMPHINTMNILYLIKFYVLLERENIHNHNNEYSYYDDEYLCDNSYYEYNLNGKNYLFDFDEYKKIDEYIMNFEYIKNKLFFKELSCKVFSPNRLFNIASIYGIEETDINELYT